MYIHKHSTQEVALAHYESIKDKYYNHNLSKDEAIDELWGIIHDLPGTDVAKLAKDFINYLKNQ